MPSSSDVDPEVCINVHRQLFEYLRNVLGSEGGGGGGPFERNRDSLTLEFLRGEEERETRVSLIDWLGVMMPPELDPMLLSLGLSPKAESMSLLL